MRRIFPEFTTTIIFLSTLMVFAGLIHTVINTAMLKSKQTGLARQALTIARYEVYEISGLEHDAEG